jgi:uncharacterized protein (DUF983 family)
LIVPAWQAFALHCQAGPVFQHTKEGFMTTPQHCPGFEHHKHLKSFICTCTHCGAQKEIFSDEFDKSHKCGSCGKEIDFSQCKLDGEA